jgi:hypothetical protein
MSTANTSAIAAASTLDEVTQPIASDPCLSAMSEDASTSIAAYERNGGSEMTSNTWHFKYWCPYCERSYCCQVEKYVCAKIQTCKLIHVKHPQQHDAFRMIREPHLGTSKCSVMRYHNDGTMADCYDSDSDSD